MQSGAALDIIPVLQQGTGTVGFQLKATPSNHEEVLDVQVCHAPCSRGLFCRVCVPPKSVTVLALQSVNLQLVEAFLLQMQRLLQGLHCCVVTLQLALVLCLLCVLVHITLQSRYKLQSR